MSDFIWFYAVAERPKGKQTWLLRQDEYCYASLVCSRLRNGLHVQLVLRVGHIPRCFVVAVPQEAGGWYAVCTAWFDPKHSVFRMIVTVYSCYIPIQR